MVTRSGRTPSCSQANKRARAAHAAHDLVQDQEHAVAIADLADRPEIARHRRHRAERRADHGLGDEPDHGLGAQALDGRLELGREPRAIGLVGLAGGLARGKGSRG